MRTTVTRTFTFDSAHSLPEHEGHCRRVHGHTYRLEVTVGGPVQQSGASQGMVLDFDRLADVVDRTVIQRLDHQYLNEILDFTPTTEAVAAWVFSTLVEEGLSVTGIRLWETPTTCAEVTE